MANRYKRKDVLQALRTMLLKVCDTVYTTSRETISTTKESFIIVRLSQGIRPYADTHNTSYVQIHLFAKDIANGVESVDREERLIEGVTSLLPFDTELMSCNEKAVMTESRSDGMGYHSVIIQFRIIIKI